MPRPAGIPTPCRSCPRSRDGKPNPAAELRGRNARLYETYLAARAGIVPPDDAGVRSALALIQFVLDRAERDQTNFPLLLTTLFGRR